MTLALWIAWLALRIYAAWKLASWLLRKPCGGIDDLPHLVCYMLAFITITEASEMVLAGSPFDPPSPFDHP